MSFFSKIWGGLKKGGRKILNAGLGGKKIFNNIWNRAKKIPVLGNVLSAVEDTPIGKAVQNLGTGIDVADAMASGDFRQALANAQNVKMKKGGMVNEDGMRAMSMRIPKFKPIPRPSETFGDFRMPKLPSMPSMGGMMMNRM